MIDRQRRTKSKFQATTKQRKISLPFAEWNKTLHAGITQKVYKRADLLVAKNGKVIFQKSTQPKQKMVPFDLASLTKPLCTALCILKLETKKKIQTSNKISDFFNTSTLTGATVKDLLNHTSGLIDWVDFQKLCVNPEEVLPRILNDKKLRPNLKKTIYSDLGYIVLGKILEKATDQTLPFLFEKLISKPLKIDKEIFFAKSATPRVNDDNAHFLGGSSGHAGLFGSTQAVHQILRELRKGFLGKSKLFPKKILEKYLLPSQKRKLSHRYFTLGFDTPTQPGSQSGQFFSAKSIGHLGFTGTSFWWDLEKDIWVIFLSEHRNPSVKHKRWGKFRPFLHDVIMKNI